VLSSRLLEGSPPARLVSVLVAALEAGGLDATGVRAAAGGAGGSQAGSYAAAWDVEFAGQPSAEVVAAAAAFVAAAQPALGPRVLLLAMFAAAGGHALLARELAFTSHEVHGFDPTHVFGMGFNAPNLIGWEWLLEACASAAARRGHAPACCALLHDGTAVWRSQMSRGCADVQASVTAAAAAGQLAVLAACLASAGRRKRSPAPGAGQRVVALGAARREPRRPA
jgi:hypothetical protein